MAWRVLTVFVGLSAQAVMIVLEDFSPDDGALNEQRVAQGQLVEGANHTHTPATLARACAMRSRPEANGSSALVCALAFCRARSPGR